MVVTILWLDETVSLTRSFFPQCGSTYTCLVRSAPETHWYVAGTSSNQPPKKLRSFGCLYVCEKLAKYWGYLVALAALECPDVTGTD